MTTKKQLIWTLIILTTSQAVGQIVPSFSMFIGTPFLVPMLTLVIFFFIGDNGNNFAFEIKAAIIICATFLSGLLDYFYAPGTHDQVGFAWQAMLWSYGLYTLFFGLTGAKFYSDFKLTKLGFNTWTLLTIIELIIFISIPIIYNRLLWSGKIV